MPENRGKHFVLNQLSPQNKKVLALAGLPRLTPPGVAQRIIQRGNNRRIGFSCEEDFSNYLRSLSEY